MKIAGYFKIHMMLKIQVCFEDLITEATVMSIQQRILGAVSLEQFFFILLHFFKINHFTI